MTVVPSLLSETSSFNSFPLKQIRKFVYIRVGRRSLLDDLRNF